jgi:MFS family permease
VIDSFQSLRHATPVRRDSLWFHRNFRQLWVSDTVSQFGTFVAVTVLPLLAVTALAATPFEMGLLTSAETAAFLLIGLPAGVWVDRMRRRLLMLWADIARAVLLTSIPVAWWLDALTLPHLIVVGLLVGVCTVFFDIAYQSYLPALVGRSKLVEGNAKLQTSQSVAQITGPGIGGGLAQLIGAANAVFTTGLGYLASALFLFRIKKTEPEATRGERGSVRAEVAEGLRFVFGNRLLRAITAATASANFFGGAILAVEVLFLVRMLGLTETGVGTILGCAGAGSVAGALTAGWWIRRFGQARTIWLVPLLTWPAQLLLPLAQPGWRTGLVVVGTALAGYGAVVYNVAQVSFRQTICPDELLGRMNASIRFVVWGTMPLGGLLGGALGELLGVRGALWVATAGQALAVLWVLLSPLRGMRDLPVTDPDQATDAHQSASS